MRNDGTVVTNQAIHRLPQVVEIYHDMARDGLSVPEQYCLNLVPVERRDSILDIGVGGGRTTGPLLEMFGNYIGIDYSEKMVAAAKLLHPQADLRVMDARKLEFNKLFDCVMFSFNGIDCIDYADRQLVFRQIAGVLRPGGYFLYSTHNLQNARTSVWLNHIFVKELFKAWPRPRTTFRRLFNRMKTFWRQSGGPSQSFAYINDGAADFRFLYTYVDIPAEIETLQRNRFEVLATIGNTKQKAGYGPEDSWVYFLARLIR